MPLRQEATGVRAAPDSEVQGASGSSVSPGKHVYSSPWCVHRVTGSCCRAPATQLSMLPCRATGDSDGTGPALIETSRRRAPGDAAPRVRDACAPPVATTDGRAALRQRERNRPSPLACVRSAQQRARSEFLLSDRCYPADSRQRFYGVPPGAPTPGAAQARVDTNGKGRPSQEGKWHTQGTRIHQMDAIRE